MQLYDTNNWLFKSLGGLESWPSHYQTTRYPVLKIFQNLYLTTATAFMVMSPKTKSDAAMYNWNSPPSFFPLFLSYLSSLFPTFLIPFPIPPPSLPLWFLSSPWKPRCCWNLFTNLLIIMQTVLAIVCQPSCYIAASCHLYLQSFIGAVYTTTLILLFGLEQITFLSELNLEHSV